MPPPTSGRCARRSSAEGKLENLQTLIRDLRPAALDELGLLAAREALLERRRKRGFEITSVLALPAPERGGRLDPELETTVYRLVQEALTNVVKHARADHVAVSVEIVADELRIEAKDNGVGFDPGARMHWLGLGGMRERVYLALGAWVSNS